MSTVVERLRGDGSSWAQPMFDEAADEIERLRAYVNALDRTERRLRAALTTIAYHSRGEESLDTALIHRTATAALSN